MTIKNFNELARTEERQKALKIIEAAYQSVNTSRVLTDKIKVKNSELSIENEKINLDDFKNIYFVGIGKTSLKSAKFLDSLLGQKLTKGICLDVEEGELENIESIKGTHPLPSDKNLKTAKKIVELVKSAREEDLIIACTSGGGSALLSYPKKINIEKLKRVNESLITSGADIYEINTVRKHISKVKGGNLAQAAYPAKVINLLFSDVPGDNPAFIASGPFIKDQTAPKDAEKVIQKYNLEKLNLFETPKDEKYFQKIKNHMLISGKNTIKAMAEECKKQSLDPNVHSDTLQGEAREVGKKIAEKSKETSSGSALLACGETTVTVEGEGKGGRNEELVLGAVDGLALGQVIISAASDGWDNTEAAGAIADGKSAQRAEKKGMSSDKYLKNNDSYHYFEKLNDLLKTGKTGSNVADFLVCINF